MQKVPEGFVRVYKATDIKPDLYTRIEDVDKIKEPKITDTIVKIAEYVNEEDWDTVLEMILDTNEQSFIKGGILGHKLK